MPVAYIHSLLRSNAFYDVADLVQRDPSQAVALNSAKSSPLLVLTSLLTRGTVRMAINQNIRRYAEGFELAFDAILSRCHAAVKHANKYGDTALIVVCREGNADSLGWSTGRAISDDMLLNVIERMIDACPEAAKVADRQGRLPLHYVLRQGRGPMQIALKMARANPDSIADHDSPILDMLDDREGWLWDRVKPFLELCPAAANAKSRLGVNAIQSVWFQVRGRPDYVARQPPGQPLPHIPSRLTDDMIAEISRKMTDGQDEFYSKARDMLLLLLKTAYLATCHDDLDSSSFHALHAAAGLVVPSELLRLMIKLFPEQLHLVDEEGRTPLHIAAAGPWKSRGFDEVDTPNGLDILSEAYPDAARVLDRNGMLPIHLALGKRNRWRKTWRFGVRALVEAEPMTLRYATGSGEYPFMLAAKGQNANLNTVYELLLANPDVLHLARGHH